jgi:membrane protein
MPALTDVPRVLRQERPFAFAKRIWKEISSDNVFTLASALAYSWLFALFPFLIFLLSFVPLVMSDSSKIQATDTINHYVNENLPEKAAKPIHEVVDEVLGGDQQQQASLMSIGLLLTIWAASGGMNTTMIALDTAYDVEKSRPFYKQRPLAMALTVLVAALVICVLILIPIGSLGVSLVEKHGANWFTRWGWDPKWISPITWMWNAVRFSLSFVLMFCLLAILYHFGPNRKTKFRFITPGSLFCVTVWILLAFFFKIYIDRFGRYEKTYGTVGGVAILLLFFYIDALVLLIGAEINGEMDLAIKRRDSAAAAVEEKMK